MDSGYINEKSKNKITGNIGEAKVYDYLVKQGYEIITTNYKTPIGEIDIIAKDETDRIIFIEVKSRSNLKHGYPREAVTKEKQMRIRRVAEYFLKVKRLKNQYVRFDVIEVLSGEITHLKNAF